MLEEPDIAEVTRALVLVADRFADGLVAAPDPAAKAGTLDWTVGQLGVHVAVGAELYAAMAVGAPSPLTTVGDRQAAAVEVLTEAGDLPVDEAAARLRGGIGQVVAAVQAAEGDLPFYEHRLPPSVFGGMYLAEMLVHSYDLGGIDLDDAAVALAMSSVTRALPFVLRPGRPARACLALRPQGHAEVRIKVGPDSVLVGGAELGPIDAGLAGSAEALLLTAYGRINPALGLLRGKVRLVGRRPWKLRAMQTRFDPP